VGISVACRRAMMSRDAMPSVFVDMCTTLTLHDMRPINGTAADVLSNSRCAATGQWSHKPCLFSRAAVFGVCRY